MRRTVVCAVLSAVLLNMLLATSTLAASPVMTNFTDHVADTINDVVTDSCQGEALVHRTVTFEGVVHVTELANGTVHVATTLVGSFTYVPLDPSLATTVGTVWRVSEHFNGNLHNEVYTNSFIIAGTLGDGPGGHRHYQEVLHFTVFPDSGEVAVEFDHLNVQCS